LTGKVATLSRIRNVEMKFLATEFGRKRVLMRATGSSNKSWAKPGGKRRNVRI